MVQTPDGVGANTGSRSFRADVTVTRAVRPWRALCGSLLRGTLPSAVKTWGGRQPLSRMRHTHLKSGSTCSWSSIICKKDETLSLGLQVGLAGVTHKLGSALQVRHRAPCPLCLLLILKPCSPWGHPRWANARSLPRGSPLPLIVGTARPKSPPERLLPQGLSLTRGHTGVARGAVRQPRPPSITASPTLTPSVTLAHRKPPPLKAKLAASSAGTAALQLMAWAGGWGVPPTHTCTMPGGGTVGTEPLPTVAAGRVVRRGRVGTGHPETVPLPSPEAGA